MAPNLGRDRAALQEHSRQRRIAEREARRYVVQTICQSCFDSGNYEDAGQES